MRKVNCSSIDRVCLLQLPCGGCRTGRATAATRRPLSSMGGAGEFGATGRTKGSIANGLYCNMFLNVTGICLLLQGRPTMLLKTLNGDTAAMTAMLSAWSSGVGLLEFLLNPMAGKLSDTYGRRAFLLASPAINTLLKAAVAATSGSVTTILMLERVINGAVTTLGGSTMCSTMLSDLYSGADLAGAYGTLGSAAGAGAVIGSFIAGRISAFGFAPRAVFWAASALAAAQIGINLALVPETLLPEKTKPFSLQFPYIPNPVAFTKLFTRSHGLRMLVRAPPPPPSFLPSSYSHLRSSFAYPHCKSLWR
eukprot:COSAG05_NODE_5084_length_1268_cov_1.157399_1_plen_308_part_00